MKNFFKRFCALFLVLSSALVIFAAEDSYKIGDIGPGGGIVFYKNAAGFIVDDGSGNEVVCHYLEVSVQDLGCVTWSPSAESVIPEPLYGIGVGKLATNQILKNSKTKLSAENSAAYLCSKYKTSTTKAGDWYLPTSDELRLVFKNLTPEMLKVTSTEFYWSSSEEENGRAWGRKNKTSTIDSKNKKFNVRAVHAF